MNLFKLIETVDNEKYFVKVFESSYYNLNVIRNKNLNRKRVELELGKNNRFVPKVHVTNEDDGFKIEVQTASYGSLNEEDFSNFIQTQRKALEHVSEIKKILEGK